MQYFGGKQRIAKQIVKVLKNNLENTKYYFEPFVGGASTILLMDGKRVASDKNEYIIEVYKAIQEGWIPPKAVSEEEYYYIKEHKDENKALAGFVGIGCSYSGKWFGGYARNSTGRNYCLNAYNSIMKQKNFLNGILFKSMDYREAHPKNALIYCDPPYSNTTKYNATGTFDSKEFWEVMREWSKNNLVFISEYSAPNDFQCVLEIPTKLDIRNKENIKEKRIEKLFKYIVS